MHGKDIAVIELIEGFALEPVELVKPAVEAFRPYRYFHHLLALAQLLVRLEAHAQNLTPALGLLLHHP